MAGVERNAKELRGRGVRGKVDGCDAGDANRELEATNRELKQTGEALKARKDLLERESKLLLWKLFVLALETLQEPEEAENATAGNEMVTTASAGVETTNAPGGRSRGLLIRRADLLRRSVAGRLATVANLVKSS